MKSEKSIFLKMENGLDSLLFSDANVFFYNSNSISAKHDSRSSTFPLLRLLIMKNVDTFSYKTNTESLYLIMILLKWSVKKIN